MEQDSKDPLYPDGITQEAGKGKGPLAGGILLPKCYHVCNECKVLCR